MKHWAVQSWFEPYIWLVTNITAENENNCTQPKVLGCCQRAELFSNLMFSSVCKLQLWGYFSDYVTVNLIIYVLAGCPSYEQFDSNPDGAPSSHLGHKETRESNTQRHAPHVESACRDKELRQQMPNWSGGGEESRSERGSKWGSRQKLVRQTQLRRTRGTTARTYRRT